jgi:hypothetical protein
VIDEADEVEDVNLAVRVQVAEFVRVELRREVGRDEEKKTSLERTAEPRTPSACVSPQFACAG